MTAPVTAPRAVPRRLRVLLVGKAAPDRGGIPTFLEMLRGGALADTHEVTDPAGTRLGIDTGFIVYNTHNYPNLTAMFEHFGVKTDESDMSFSLSLDHGALEWCGDNLASVFAQKRNLLRPSFLLMLREIFRFNRLCLTDREAGHLKARSIGDYLDWRGFSPGFMNNYLVPMAAAIWSTPAKRMMEFPATYFVNFFENHRLIHSERPIWRTVTGGSRNYLEKLLAPLAGRVRLGAGVVAVRGGAEGVGKATTRSVVQAISAIIVTDMLFAFVATR